MKRFKKMMAIAIVAVMTLTMSSMFAFADQTYTITVTNTQSSISISGKEYAAYKVFDMTYNTDKTAYSYTIKSTDWAFGTLTKNVTADSNGVYENTTYGIKLVPSASDSTVYVVQLKDTSGKYPGDTGYDSTKLVFDDDMATTLAADLLAAGLPSTNNGSVTIASGTETGTINVNPDVAGYYAVYGTATSTADSSKTVTAALALTNTEPSATVNPKASVPTVDKKITSVTNTDNTSGTVLDTAGNAAVAQVGSTVGFEIDSVVPDLTGYSNYIFTINDTLSAGLTFTDPDGDATNDVAVTVNSVDKTSDCTISTSGQTLTVTIPYDKLKTYTQGQAIVVTYTAVVNSNALTYNYEKNTATITYSNDPTDGSKTDTTPGDNVYLIDLNLDVDKVAESSSGDKLSGATFILYKEVTADGSETATKYYYVYDSTNGKVTWTTTKSSATTFKTDSTGKLKTQIQGLDAGTFYLEETVAPDGYNLLSAPIAVTITATESTTDGTTTVTYSATYDEADAAMSGNTITLGTLAETQPIATGTIVNNAGSQLPSTGGIGTTLFYLIGAILVIGAGVVLVTRRRVDGSSAE